MRCNANTVIALALFTCASAPAEQAAVTIGSQRYILSERNADGVPNHSKLAGSIAAADGICTIAYGVTQDPVGEWRMRNFGDWAQPLGPSVVIESIYVGETSTTGRHGDACWVIYPAEYDIHSQILDLALTPRSPVFSVTPHEAYFERYATASDDGTILYAIAGQGPPYPQGIVLARLFGFDGTPQSDTIVLRDEPNTGFSGVSATFLPDGSFVLAYYRGGRNARLYLQRVGADLVVEQPIEVATIAGFTHLRRLDDGRVLLICEPPHPGGAFAQWYDDALSAIGEAAPLPESLYTAAARDGRFALCGSYAGEEVTVQLFDADGSPVAPPLEFALDTRYATHSFFGIASAMAYEDDGKIWILWSAENGNGPDGPVPYFLTQLKPFDPGDMNYDGVVDNGDIDAFVLALTAPEVYESLYPGVPYQFIGDMNEDGAFDNGDIDGFVAALLE